MLSLRCRDIHLRRYRQAGKKDSDTPVSGNRSRCVFARAFAKTASPVPGAITFLQEQIEWHLRVGSRFVGLPVGVLPVIGLVRKLRRR